MISQEESMLFVEDSNLPGDSAQFGRQQILPEAHLSPRERSVLKLISCGLSNKLIAREMSIAPETVKSHAKNILVKFRAKTRAEAVAYAAQRHLI